MSNSIEIRVPDLGDFSGVEVIEVLVKPGDVVAREDGLITLETDKASMDVPSTHDGVIESVSVVAGDKVSVGDLVVTLAIAESAAPTTPAQVTEVAEDVVAPVAPVAEVTEVTFTVPDLGEFNDVDVIEVHVAPGDEVAIDDSLVTLETDKASMDVPATAAGVIESVLLSVGDKASTGSAVATAKVTMQTAASVPETAPAVATSAPVQEQAAQLVQQAPVAPIAKATTLPTIDEAGFSRAHASPSVRKLARELGVNLIQVKGSGLKQRILQADVKGFVKAILSGQLAGPSAALPKVPEVDFAKFGEIDTQPLTRIQKISGPRLQASWINLPHVTQHDLADITELEAKRQALKGVAKQRGISLTPLAFILKACVAALQKHAKVNSSLSADGQSLVFKKYYHIGFAADTDNGLVVPVIRDVDRKDVYEIAEELAELSSLARDGKLKANQLQGASFTVSSLGGIGGTAFTPIVNAPEVAILGVSRSSMQPVWNGKDFVPRLLLPLSLSYDHRVVDGAEAVRFTTYLGQVLGDVDSLLQAIP